MTIKSIKQTLLIIVAIMGIGSVLIVSPVNAAKCNGVETSIISCDDGSVGSCSDGSKPTNGTCKNEGLCPGGTAPDNNNKCPNGKKVIKYIPPNDITKSGVWSLLIIGINILTAGVGVAAVAGIVWGAALFLTAAGSPDQFRKAKMVIWNTVIGIVVYAAMYAFMNYIIPGGLFS